MMAPKKEPPPLRETWRCKCGAIVLQHHEYCAHCGAAKPVPGDARGA